MIPADLLNALREKDPEIHSRYVNLMQDIDPLCEGDIPFCQNAWLQHCLQEAIRARAGWGYQITSFGLPVIANVYNRREYTTGRGDTEAEALGWAYLEAIEAIRQ